MAPSILDRYVWKELGPPFLIGVGVFTFFLFIDRIYQLTNLIITKNVPVHLVLSLLGLMLPPFITLTLPLSLLVAVLLVGGRLAGDFEVTAMRAAGISPVRLFRPFAVFAALATGLILTLTLLVNPWAIGGFQAQLFKILQTRATTGLQERTFSGAFGQIVMYVEEITPSELALKGVLVSDERQPGQSRIILAREGRLLTDEAARRLTLRFIDGSISEMEVADPRRFRHTAFRLYDMNLPLDSPLATVTKDEKPERQMGLGALLHTAGGLGRQGQIVTPYYVELHKRFALPVAALVFYRALVQAGERVKEFQGKVEFVLNVEQGERRFVVVLPPEAKLPEGAQVEVIAETDLLTLDSFCPVRRDTFGQIEGQP